MSQKPYTNLTDTQIAALLEHARRRLTGSLYEFMKASWHVVEPSTEFVEGWHLKAICKHLEAVSRGEIRNIVINMPPRHCKSLLTGVFWPAWVWASQPGKRFLVSSYAHALALRDSLRCRRFPETRITTDQNQKARYETNSGGFRIATSVQGSATGEGGDFIIVDDPHKVGEAESERVRTSVIGWWDKTMSTRGNDPKTVCRVVVGQRVHESDLCGHLLSQGGYDWLCLPAEYDGVKRPTSLGWEDPRDKVDDLLWPERFGADEIKELKIRLGSFAAASQLQQQPAPAEGGLVQSSWWRYYSSENQPSRFDLMIQSWDCAFKGKSTSDFVVGQVWGVSSGNYYLVDQVRGRWTFSRTVAEIQSLKIKYPDSSAILIEDAANGPAIIDSLKQKLPGVIAVRPDGGKLARFQSIAPVIESGNVYLPTPKHSPWVDDLVHEVTFFPNGSHDDQVDAMSQALRRLLKSSGTGAFRPIKGILRRR